MSPQRSIRRSGFLSINSFLLSRNTNLQSLNIPGASYIYRFTRRNRMDDIGNRYLNLGRIDPFQLVVGGRLSMRRPGESLSRRIFRVSGNRPSKLLQSNSYTVQRELIDFSRRFSSVSDDRQFSFTNAFSDIPNRILVNTFGSIRNTGMSFQDTLAHSIDQGLGQPVPSFLHLIDFCPLSGNHERITVCSYFRNFSGFSGFGRFPQGFLINGKTYKKEGVECGSPKKGIQITLF